MPAALISEGLADRGILVGGANDFQERSSWQDCLGPLSRGSDRGPGRLRRGHSGSQAGAPRSGHLCRYKSTSRIVREVKPTLGSGIFFAHLDKARSQQIFGTITSSSPASSSTCSDWPRWWPNARKALRRIDGVRQGVRQSAGAPGGVSPRRKRHGAGWAESSAPARISKVRRP